MVKNRIDILSTGSLDERIADLAATHAIHLDIIPFIKTEAITYLDQQIIKELSLQPLIIVFTSSNAVNIVAPYYQVTSKWSFYCIGKTTCDLVKEKFGEAKILGSASNATRLAAKIIQDQPSQKIVFFCGDQRRDELPDLLRESGKSVQEITVYNTVPTPVLLSKHYDGIIFYSPSGVHSFFSLNTIHTGCRIFAIGETTAAAIRNYVASEIIFPAATGKKELIEAVIEYFNTSPKNEPTVEQ